MSETLLISGRDMVLFAIPFLSPIFISQFRMDGLAKPSKRSVNWGMQPCGMHSNREPIMRDPDGNDPLRVFMCLCIEMVS